MSLFRFAARRGLARPMERPIEDVGVASPLDPYDMTFRDLTCANRDLLAYCVRSSTQRETQPGALRY